MHGKDITLSSTVGTSLSSKLAEIKPSLPGGTWVGEPQSSLTSIPISSSSKKSISLKSCSIAIEEALAWLAWPFLGVILRRQLLLVREPELGGASREC